MAERADRGVDEARELREHEPPPARTREPLRGARAQALDEDVRARRRAVAGPRGHAAPGGRGPASACPAFMARNISVPLAVPRTAGPTRPCLVAGSTASSSLTTSAPSAASASPYQVRPRERTSSRRSRATPDNGRNGIDAQSSRLDFARMRPVFNADRGRRLGLELELPDRLRGSRSIDAFFPLVPSEATAIAAGVVAGAGDSPGRARHPRPPRSARSSATTSPTAVGHFLGRARRPTASSQARKSKERLALGANGCSTSGAAT